MNESYQSGLPSPASVISMCYSSETFSDDQIPSTLVAEELQLALNKEATEAELNKAILRCKELVLNSEQCSPERKWLVRHLIELRLRLQECKEALLDPQHPRNKSSGVSRRVIKGHHLNLQPLLRTSTTKYCDHCTGIIWNVVQAWYECEDCEYCCHHKCISSIVRECAHVVASEKGCYELDICPEVGLSMQRYLCAECKTPLSITGPTRILSKIKALHPPVWIFDISTWLLWFWFRLWRKGKPRFLSMIKSRSSRPGFEFASSESSNVGEARRCDYNGYYYCSACHWGSMAIIPARAVHNWDLTPYPVCQASLQQLKVTVNRPLINLTVINPRLFSLVHELDLVRRSRQELYGMRKYLLVCRMAKEDHLLWKNVDTPHLIESTDLYSLQDLVNTSNGELITKLHNLSEIFLKHIKETCQICQGRGHICEICLNNEILFPFDALAVICQDCGAVYHKNCFNLKREICQKCLRIKDRLEKSTLFSDDNGD